MKNLKKISIPTSLILIFTLLLIVCSLQTTFAANQTINDTSAGGILGGIGNASASDTVFLQSGTYNKTGQDTGITITKNITIQGNGSTDSVIIDAKELSRIFTIGNGYNVTFINITFINGHATEFSGSILSNYTNTRMTIINCKFINSSSDANSGAVFSRGSGLIVINSTFIDNYSGGTGGAIAIYGANSQIINSTFNNNTASQYAGAIFDYALNTTIINSTFLNNRATTDGGAIRMSAANLTIINSTFVNNTAGSYYGAVYCGSPNATIINSVFDSNSAGINGGAVYIGSNSIIINSTFNNNTARSNGGAVVMGSNNATINGSKFTNNAAGGKGGAIYSNGDNKTILNNTIIGNSASGNGGSIFNQGNTTIFNNIMVANSADLGQMIYNNGTMGILNLTFINNSTWIVKNGSEITLFATLVDDMGNTVTGQNISFYLDGVFYENAESIEGKVNISYTPSNAGNIPVSGEYTGIGTYDILISDGLLKIKISTNITISVPKEVKVGDTVTLESKLTDEKGNPIAGATVDFYVDGVKVGSGVTDSNGITKLNYTFTKAGKPNIITKYTGNDTYLASNATNSTTVSKIPTTITVETDEDTITATLTDKDGNPLANKEITITINGKTYKKTTNSKGQVIIKYKNAWDYKVTANFAGDNQYLASKATAPKRTPTKVTIKTEGDKITATLTDKNGKPLSGKKLTFRVKGVIIGVGITDANGQVVIYYKNANKKAVTVSFEGDEEYAPSSATSTPESDNVQVSGKVAMKNTGIPIVAILLALITSIGIVTLRKRE